MSQDQSREGRLPRGATPGPAGEEAVRAARAILGRVFARARPGIAFRLWDGSEMVVGRPDDGCVVVVGSPGAFRRAFTTANTAAIAEEFVRGEIDVEGDLFAAMRIANQLDEAGPGLLDRLRIGLQRRRIPLDG